MEKTDFRFFISGAGDLGLRVLRRLLQSGRVPGISPQDCICETQTGVKNPILKSMGLAARVPDDSIVSADNILICFPPSPDYPSQVERVLRNWNKKGRAVLISSTTVFTEKEGAWVGEDSPIQAETPIARAEKIAIENGAHVVRLAGLYDRARGPHVFWQARPQIDNFGEGWINLIHRTDAANFISEFFMRDEFFDPKVWNLSDGNPLTRNEISKLWSDWVGVAPSVFTGVEGDMGKRISSRKSHEALQWVPRFESFKDFILSFKNPRNVFGGPLKICCDRPVTGFYRDGSCKVGDDDFGVHSVCCEITNEFLEFSKAAGNDLSTPRVEFGFPGLKSGDRWCLCASRWMEALIAGKAPRIYLESTAERTLEFVEIEVLKKHGLDLS